VIELLSRYPGARGRCVRAGREELPTVKTEHHCQRPRPSRRRTQHCLADANGEVDFEIASDNPGDHRVRVGAARDGIFGELGRHATRVAARRLDSLIEDGTVAVDAGTLAHMNVQGHEGQILAGASRLLAAGGPIAMEFWPYGLRRADGVERILGLLPSFDRILNLEHRGALLDTRDVRGLIERLDADGGHVDLLLVP
jgi:hypothetical protein